MWHAWKRREIPVYTWSFVRKYEYKRPLGRSRQIWKYNIKMDPIDFIWLRIGTGEELCEHGNAPSGCVKCA
jgi:hypothetical protein